MYTAIIIVGIGLSLVLVGSSLYFFLRRLWKKSRKATDFKCSYDTKISKLEIKKKNLIFDTQNLDDGTSTIGVGMYGTVVYKGRLVLDRNLDLYEDVAIKVVNHGTNEIGLKHILNEIKILAYLEQGCPYIVKLLGVSDLEGVALGEVISVMEFCPLGSLKTYLQTPLEDLFNQLAKWSEQIAVGMDYLTSKKVLYIDLGTRNVLLTEDKTAKICNFGLARKLNDDNLNYDQLNEPIPFKWVALEGLRKLQFTPKTDVWAYGVTIWEIYNLGREPYPSMGVTELICFLESGGRLKIPSFATEDIYEEIKKCWDSEPESRPSFSSLATFFHALQEEL